MKRLAALSFSILVMTCALPTLSSESAWTTLAILWGEDSLCEDGGVDLVLVQPDGLDVSRKKLEFAQPSGPVSSWDVPKLQPGTYRVDAIVTGCEGGREAIHRIETVVTSRDIRKTIGVYLHYWQATLKIVYFAAPTEIDGTGLFEAASGGFRTQFRYVGSEPIHPCIPAGRVTLKYMVEGEWGLSHAEEIYGWDRRTELIASGQVLPISQDTVGPYVPSDAVRPVTPSAKRLEVDITRTGVTTYPEGERGTSSLPSCDTYVANLPLQEDEPTFYLPSLEPEVPDLEPVPETEE